MAKTMSVRMDDQNYEFLRDLSKDEKADLSQAVRELVYKGRIMLAVERYRDRRASLGKAAELAGLPVGRMIEILSEYGVESNLEHEDYLKGLQYLRKAW
jgi:predicted HTH domain antitoxin